MKQFLQGVTGVEGYLIFSMLVFLTFFIGLLIWVYRADKSYITKMKNLPLENEFNNQPDKLQ
jgi:cytochrome c oxidase cbb3-type subunit 4